MKIALAQLNPTVGDLQGNRLLMEAALKRLDNQPVDLVVFPELILTGYPPRDLLTFEWFIQTAEEELAKLLRFSESYPETALLFGTLRRHESAHGKGLVNAALLIQNGAILHEQWKQLLPTYDVFDEARYFDSGDARHYDVFPYRGEKLGISICEDSWSDPSFEQRVYYDRNPIEELAGRGATLMINIAASPFHKHKEVDRYRRNAHHAVRWGCPFVAVNQVGANDELIFDGRSMALDAQGGVAAVLKGFEEDLVVVDTERKGSGAPYAEPDEMQTLQSALVLGLRDYMAKCGFTKALIGLSGGIDSALVAAIAVAALGAENVLGVTMPSHFSSSGSVDDSRELAKNLGIRCDVMPIREIYDAFISTLTKPFEGQEPNVAEENLQARARGTLLMAYSNKFGHLLLTTGNKSELAVGYCTLYGDMDGGLAVISDLPKTTVYRLARWWNREREIIPENTLTKAPSAELRPDQTDQDTLPPYEVLDPILAAYLEEGKGPDEIAGMGFDLETVRWVLRAVNVNEYKRWQAPPGLRVSSKAFGLGRRMPIAAKY